MQCSVSSSLCFKFFFKSILADSSHRYLYQSGCSLLYVSLLTDILDKPENKFLKICQQAGFTDFAIINSQFCRSKLLIDSSELSLTLKSFKSCFKMWLDTYTCQLDVKIIICTTSIRIKTYVMLNFVGKYMVSSTPIQHMLVYIVHTLTLTH